MGSPDSKTAQLELQKKPSGFKEKTQNQQKLLDAQLKRGELTQRAYELQKQELDLAEKKSPPLKKHWVLRSNSLLSKKLRKSFKRRLIRKKRYTKT